MKPPSVLRTSPPLWGEGSAMPAKPLHRGRGWGGSSFIFYSSNAAFCASGSATST